MGLDFARAALAAGHAMVATGRNSDRVSAALGQSNDLLAVKLDVTIRANAEVAVRAAVERFDRIDVLINNAASFYAGYFEELTPDQMDRQLAASLIGPMNVTRAVLPVMRKQRSGQIISISSSAGLSGFEFETLPTTSPRRPDSDLRRHILEHITRMRAFFAERAVPAGKQSSPAILEQYGRRHPRLDPRRRIQEQALLLRQRRPQAHVRSQPGAIHEGVVLAFVRGVAGSVEKGEIEPAFGQRH
jgi:NAD(P)-dependent dehydrogenase (short-subunit alcohol dehydrogenase family)